MKPVKDEIMDGLHDHVLHTDQSISNEDREVVNEGVQKPVAEQVDPVRNAMSEVAQDPPAD